MRVFDRYMGDDNSKATIIQKLVEIEAVAKELGMTMGQLAIAWALAYNNVSTCILGASKVEQLEENCKALENLDKVTPEICQRINKILNNAPEIEFCPRKMKPLPNRR